MLRGCVSYLTFGNLFERSFHGTRVSEPAAEAQGLASQKSQVSGATALGNRDHQRMGFSLLRHSGLAQTGKISGFE